MCLSTRLLMQVYFEFTQTFSDTGNIRVYCRIRPFLSGKKDKQSIVELIGENDLVVANPSKEGKDALRSFKFNKVFGSATTQGFKINFFNTVSPFFSCYVNLLMLY